MQKYDGVMDDATEFVGSYNAFDIHEPLTFTWLPYANEKVDPARLPYRITTWQIGPWAILSGWIDLNDPTTLSLEADDYEILRTQHHWATLCIPPNAPCSGQFVYHSMPLNGGGRDRPFESTPW